MPWTEGTGVLQGGDQNIIVYASDTKAVDASTAIIGELVDFSGIGASKETKEFKGYHYTKTHKFAGKSTAKDISFTEYLTKDGLDALRGKYDDGDKFYVVIVDANAQSDNILYACYGEISDWGMELPDGDKCKITYTMVLDDDNVTDITVTNDGGDDGEDEGDGE